MDSRVVGSKVVNVTSEQEGKVLQLEPCSPSFSEEWGEHFIATLVVRYDDGEVVDGVLPMEIRFIDKEPDARPEEEDVP